MENLEQMKRTHMCTEVNKTLVGNSVTVMGWVHKRRNLGQLIFLSLRDRTGLLQVVINQEKQSNEILEKCKEIRSEYVIAVTGKVINRTEKNINPEMETGDIEIDAEEIRILSASELTPFSVLDTGVKDDLRLKYRYIDLRRLEMQNNIMIRHKVSNFFRNFLTKEGFIDIETPMLTRSTPEGARDYLVPSREYSGSFFALPQSPQIFKQLLMISGFDKYYQIVKCFRDEDLRSDRQPEFTQVDIEMSFVDRNDIIKLMESLISQLFKEILNVEIATPFIQMPYSEAMERYGSDKPDTRFGLELANITDIVSNFDFEPYKSAIKNGGRVGGINAKNCGSYTRKKIDSLIELSKYHKAKGLSYIVVEENNNKTSLSKFLNDEQINSIVKSLNGEAGDLLLICADSDNIVFEALGNIRLEIAKNENLIDENKFNFLWVIDFPLFEVVEDKLTSSHHPFTMPLAEDLHLLDNDIEKVRSDSYDIVLNGFEIGGGSIRIHDTKLQEKIFTLLSLSKEETDEKFGFLIDALKYGTPPHGGIAFGLDRIIMLIVKSTSIRDVIAFPKVKDTSCPLTNAPADVREEQIVELGIKIEKLKV
ncbi:MAG: aspartate--tRNA ligase [Defluviitaleaceae bacterium]|nr:aspartate--tRNA ligase [Defluviitaleaceae bacterium]